jgi:glycosyltransferase involved in cell wall biosynthesis
MLKCTYIVLLNNNEDNIPRLVNSLQQIEGNFKKEFIIIDDGSKDNSLKAVKIAVNDLPKTTIITQETKGPAISINEAVGLATGDYIHFVEGDEILRPDSSALMMESCLKFGAEVACSRFEESDKNFTNKKLALDIKLIMTPLQSILLNKIPAVRNIGGSSTLVQRDLIEKIGKADNSIYSQTMSLSLRCAKYSNFVFINNVLSRKNKILPQDARFEAYNNLRAIYNFVSNHQMIFEPLLPELFRNLSSEVLPTKHKIYYYLRSLYTKRGKLEEVLEFYKKEYEELF